MKKESILAGVGGGIAFGIIQSFTLGPIGGVFMGLFFGVGISVFLHTFANSKSLKNQINLPDAVLLPGERALLTKPANLVIEPKSFGLENFAFGDLLWTVGMRNKESLGGAMHLTNYRIIFKSHRFNRLRGMTSIFLPTIQQLENRSVLVVRKLAVATNSAKVVFVVGGVDDVIFQIASAREQIDEKSLATLKNHVAIYPEKCNDALQPWNAVNKLNNLLNLGRKASGATGAIANPLGTLGSLFMSELLDKTLAEKWQKAFDTAEQRNAARSHSRSAA